MNRTQNGKGRLASELNIKLNIKHKTAHVVVTAFFDIIAKGLKDKGKVDLGQLGTLEVHKTVPMRLMKLGRIVTWKKTYILWKRKPKSLRGLFVE